MIGSLCLASVLYLAFTRRTRKYPPGPPARPLIGNLLTLSFSEAWCELMKYKAIYGDLMFFHGLGNHILVVSSMQVLNDLLEKKGGIYSDRPTFTVVGELMGLGQSMPLLPYGEEWRIQRKLAHSALSPSAVRKYYTIQEDLAATLGKQLLDNPDDFFNHIRLTASRLILSITYGLSVDTADSEYITHAEETMHMISRATVPGAYLCDFLPFLKYLPSWVPFQRSAREGKDMIARLVTKPFERVQQDMAKGTALPSLTQVLLTEAENESLHNHIKWSTGSLYGAGGETTYAIVITCILAMALNGDKLKLAQEELDRIVGTDRLPNIGDRPHLPYVEAVIKETMRWHPALPLSIARCTAKDDVYQGYEIPKGTIVIPNVWAIAFEKRGPYDPTTFVPERFLEEASAENAPVDPTLWAFGFARRICPGKYLAENSLFILISTILTVFDMRPPPDEELTPRFAAGLVSYPLPFSCRITPRSPSRAAQIKYRVSQCIV
ncbi:cytochrome P450 [Daedaleopsis nitida]|nr:cytochrome P450 [Daedaleopsis nitida]